MTNTDHPSPPAPNSVSAGFLQFDVHAGDIRHNLEQVEKQLRKLAMEGPGIVVLPELWSAGFDYDSLPQAAVRTPEILDRLQALCRERNIYLAGSLPEAVLTEVGTSYHNTMYVCGPEGVAGSYRKQRLFGPMQEDLHFSAGDSPQPINTDLGKVASLICFDLRFPELVRTQVLTGAGILLVSAQWPAARIEHWRTLLKARAIENQLYVVACNRCGITGDTEFGGHSAVIAPDGTVLAEAGYGKATANVSLHMPAVAEARSLFNTISQSPYSRHDQEKIMTLAELKQEAYMYKKLGRRMVFTNGCFDILHKGHATYLEAARKQGDCLVVGLNSDRSVRELKGPERPMNNEQNRARVLAALGCVDFIVIFDEDTPHRLITILMPDVLVKGGDWPVEKIVGATEVLAAGGIVLSMPFIEDFSTTSLITKIRKSKTGQ